jgi:hypothetical protein
MPQSDEFDEALSRAAARADSLRAAGLKGLESVTLARQVSLEREQARLAGELGAEHPRVKALAARVQDGVARLGDLKVDIVRAETIAPKVGAAEWVLHGYVWSEDRSPAPDLVVSLVDAQGQWLRALGFAATDARGYFQLRASVADAATPGAAPPGAAPPAGSAPVEAFVRVTDANRTQVHRGPTPVPIAAGRVEYEEIVLEGGAVHGGVSPEEVPGHSAPSPEPGKKPRRRT